MREHALGERGPCRPCVRRFWHRSAVAACFVVAVAVPRCAVANGRTFDDPYDVPDAPRPDTLPELTHAAGEATFETTAGAIVPNPGQVRRHAYVERLAVELPLGFRRWFVGATYELAQGDSGREPVVSGNLEIQGRTLWATPTGLGFGGGLGLLVPLAHFDDGSLAQNVAVNAASLRPWDVSFFVPSAFGARPFVDVRAIDGPFVAQFRQGLDVMFSTTALANWRVYATAGVYLGWRVAPAVDAGFDAMEAYSIDVPGVRDGARATVVVSPSVRLGLRWIEPAISAFTNIGTPLEGASQHVWGFRVALTFTVLPLTRSATNN